MASSKRNSASYPNADEEEQQPPLSSAPASALSSLRTYFTPSQPSSILSDLAPQLLHPSILSSPHFSPSANASALGTTTSSLRSRLGLPGWNNGSALKESSTSIYIRERVDDLLRMDVPAAPFDLSNTSANALGQSQRRIDFPAPDAQVPLIRGFLATTPAARGSREARRRKRAGLGELALGLEDGSKLGLKERGEQARGLLSSADAAEAGELGINRRASGVGVGPGARGARKRKSGRRSELLTPGGSLGRSSGSGLGSLEEEGQPPEMSPEELQTDVKAVEEDMGNVAVRRVSRASLRRLIADDSR